ncbi:MAG TPA: DUF3109 family protein [Candidatus Ozemobacteraceae bacterium]|nr:DUF3109 family protein [Candidatus Ozemobacteraceae bacterium]
MHQIGQVLIADDVWETRFACDLSSCRGCCCAIGERGTPIDADEAEKLAQLFPAVQHRIPKSSVQFLKNGVAETYKGNLYIREVAHNEPCPFAFRDEHSVLLCSVHAHCLEEKLPLYQWKPLWCSLYPFVLKQAGDLWLLNQYIAPHCRSLVPAPLMLDWGAPVLGEILGKDWLEELSKELAREFGTDRARQK